MYDAPFCPCCNLSTCEGAFAVKRLHRQIEKLTQERDSAQTELERLDDLVRRMEREIDDA